MSDGRLTLSGADILKRRAAAQAAREQQARVRPIKPAQRPKPAKAKAIPPKPAKPPKPAPKELTPEERRERRELKRQVKTLRKATNHARRIRASARREEALRPQCFAYWRELAKIYPGAFAYPSDDYIEGVISEPRPRPAIKPLSRHVVRELVAAADTEDARQFVPVFVEWYRFRDDYLYAVMAADAARVHLDGTAAEPIEEKHKAEAEETIRGRHRAQMVFTDQDEREAAMRVRQRLVELQLPPMRKAG